MESIDYIVFLGVVAFVVGASAWLVSRATGHGTAMLLGDFTWMATVAGMTQTNLLLALGPAPIMVVVLGGSVLLAASAEGKALAQKTPLVLLLGIQVFRLPLEWLLHRWGSRGLIPVDMTWAGQNFDVVAPLVILAFLPIVHRWPKTAWIPNLVGTALLVNVLRVVAISVPGPLYSGVQPPLTLPFSFPFVWLPTVLVLAAIAFHLVTFRALMMVSKTT